MRKGRKSGDGGFAMLEALVVLLLSTLIFQALLLSAYLVTRSSAAASRDAGSVERLATGLTALRRDLSEVAAIKTSERPGAPLLFYGGERAIGLATGSTDQLVWISARSGDLVRSAIARLPSATGFEKVSAAPPTALLQGAWDYRFSFAQNTGKGIVWSSSWFDRPRLPDIIRLQIWSKSDARRAPLTLVVSPHVDPPRLCPEGASCEGGANAT
ncbi:hypothetical protein [Rhizobium grahamii]|uniref:General secretion pathway protein J n=1 Tax=Rhizobium grahamii CCGE 502 TaxID=990285 RepID=S3HP48_9HYPH|nr:hypothetical protein [Rhizobium grahamii]EPE95146.1 hypothetical protein RGCCGE502_27412 [Rhizobium grahamii CCGE 502]